MFIFGHAAITLITATALTGVLYHPKGSPAETEDKILETPPGVSRSIRSTFNSIINKPWQWLSLLGKLVDIRILLIGSLLPDIIDKPVGVYFFRSTFDNGRIFSHTLLFLVLTTVIGFYLYKRCRQNWLLVLSFGTFTHLILDGMWSDPRTLLWPLYGFSFARVGESGWLQRVIQCLLEHPAHFIPEGILAVLSIYLIWLLASKGKLYSLIRYGKL